MSIENYEESIIQNLKDAGCDPEMIACFIEDLRSGKEINGMKRLTLHRRKLVEGMHKEQERIDCLDYLIYKLKKTKK